MLKSINPYTLQLIEEYPEINDTQLEKILNRAQHQFKKGKQTPLENRLETIQKFADLLRVYRVSLARLIVDEMGKIYKEAEGEILKCAQLCDYYVEIAPKVLARKKVRVEGGQAYVSHQPLGIVLGIMPWNFPFWQVIRFAIPALIGGNSVLLKHASNVMGCALKIEELFLEAGLPDHLFKSLLISGKNVHKAIQHPLVQAISLTGSEQAGSAAAALAGKSIKKSVLELGGNDAYLILEDANIDLAIKEGLASRMKNAGQSCIGAKRFIVCAPVYDVFVERLEAAMKIIQFGDPYAQDSQIGPLVSQAQRQEVHQQVIRSQEA